MRVSSTVSPRTARQPADQFLQPLGINAFRGGGWFSGGWIKDNYQYGSATQADVDSIIAQAKRLTQAAVSRAVPGAPERHLRRQRRAAVEHEVPVRQRRLLELGQLHRLHGGGAAGVGAARSPTTSDNEPDISVFWTRGVNSTQYFQMWDTAYREIRRIAPGAQIVGPSFAFTPQSNPGEWQTWLAHVKAAGTVPDMITNHDEGDVDDPVTVVAGPQQRAVRRRDRPAAAVGERVPAGRPADRRRDRLVPGAVRAVRVHQRDARQLGLLHDPQPDRESSPRAAAPGSRPATGGRCATYADMTGTLVYTSGQVGSTAISACPQQGPSPRTQRDRPQSSTSPEIP